MIIDRKEIEASSALGKELEKLNTGERLDLSVI